MLHDGSRSSDRGSVIARVLRRRGSRRALNSAAEQIASGLGLAIQREADVTNSTSAFVALNPDVSQTEFLRWLEADRTHANYPELATVQLDRIVLASQLRSYQEHAAAVRPQGRGAFTVIPPGKRPFYCLTAAGTGWGSIAAPPPGWIDACALPGTQGVLLSARDIGRAVYLALPYQNRNVLEVETPVYRSGVTVRSVAARQRAFVGWLGETILANVVLASALRGHPGTALTVSYHATGYQAAFSYGHALANAGHVTLPLAGDWTARVSGPIASASVFGQTDALGLLAGGTVLSLLLGTLVYVLASGRARARRLVRQRTGQLEHLAMHDALTGLPNRVLALDRAEQLLARARRTGKPVAALYMDVDRFKHINDNFGHAAGDQFLRQFAGRLRDELREGDTAARLAGDEFLVLLDGQTLDVGPELVAERLLEALREPYDLGEPVVRHLLMGASIGIAYGRQSSAEQLLADADVALYAAKAAGRNRYAVFESSMQTASQDRLSLEFDLADALDNGELFLAYQPIIELATERIVAVEALVRWRHPTRGLIGPDIFIPIAEQNGQILEIGRWVLREACQQVAAWHAAGRRLGLSVNVSGRQLDTDDLFDDVRQALRTAPLDHSALTLEITETAVMTDPQAAARRLGAIRALGVQVAIDDFGTGYSSLACLAELPIDLLKIDRSFINAVGTSSRSAAVIHTLIQLGKTVALQTLGEGIEDDTQLRHLQAEGCDYGQGFLFARPMEAEQLDELLRRAPAQANPAPSSGTAAGQQCPARPVLEKSQLIA